MKRRKVAKNLLERRAGEMTKALVKMYWNNMGEEKEDQEFFSTKPRRMEEEVK